MRANQRVAQYFSLYFWVLWPSVQYPRKLELERLSVSGFQEEKEIARLIQTEVQQELVDDVIHEVMMDTALREGRKREGLTEKVKQVSQQACMTM